MGRVDLTIPSGDTTLAAWHHRPDTAEPHPTVLLAHGFGATRDAALGRYAERFVDAGMAAIVFDYRHFGASGGQPRQLLSVGRQLADWRAVLAFAREHPSVDAGRIALWGTSFAGEHDDLTPAAAARELADRAPLGQFTLRPTGHFDPYFDPWFDEVVTEQVEFLAAHLRP